MTKKSNYFELVLVLSACLFAVNAFKQCDLWNKSIKKPCNTRSLQGFSNLISMSGAYCFNNGSGICKGFSGRFEYLFNTFTDEFLGPVPESQYVDSNGYHERVPVSYNVNGSIQYADKSINWAKQFKKTIEDNPISLLSINEFNWCAYTENDWWPYTTAIRDMKSNGRYLIYFFNRQSCIVDTETNDRQHYNTRFLHNSSLRIDLDINPVIFAMEDRLNNDIRLVKHRRQHWYEVSYEVVKQPKNDIRLFVKMSDTEKLPSKINSTSGPLIPAVAYDKYVDFCISDHYQKRAGKNSILVPAGCGFDPPEIADYTYAEKKYGSPVINEVHIHSIPRFPSSTENFYGVHVRLDQDWEIFARDGLSFSATTTIPVNPEKCNPSLGNSLCQMRVISLYSKFRNYPKDLYDENYPTPYIADYIATYKPNRGSLESSDWQFERDSKSKEVKNLNYVDDIAYLYECKSILVIFGPLYTELPTSFDMSTKAPIDSIYELGLWEMTSAFFNMPDTNTLWFYHRYNYVTSHTYTCGSKSGVLVTATRSGKYYPRAGPSTPKFFRSAPPTGELDHDHSEEAFFQLLGVFKGDLSNPEAPDPSRYPIGNIGPAQPQKERSNVLVYIIIGVGIILILAMCIACLATLRRRHRKRMQRSMRPMSTMRSGLGGSNISRSQRSALSSGMNSLGSPTARSMLSRRPSHSGSTRSRSTTRSGLSRGNISGGPTTRSGMSSRASSRASSRGSSNPSKSTRSTQLT